MINIRPKASTVIKGSDLGVGLCLPDGIYCFKITSCGVTGTRNTSITEQLECGLDEVVKKIASEEIGSDIGIELNSYLQAIKSAAKIGQPKKANRFHKLLTKKLNNLNCGCKCQ